MKTLRIGEDVLAADGSRLGTIERLVVDEGAHQVTHLIVEDRVVPLAEFRDAGPDGLATKLDRAGLEAFPRHDESSLEAPGEHWEPPAGYQLQNFLAVAGRGERLALLLPVLFAHRRRRLERAAADLGRLSPAQQLARRSTELAERARRLEAAVLRSLAQTRVNLANRTGRLEALAPEAVLARGYSITEDETTGHVLRGAMETAAGRRLRIRLAAGSLAARVEEVRR